MWKLLRAKDEECWGLRGALEEAAGSAGEGVSAEKLMEALSEEDRKHMELCGNCHEAAEELAATKKLFRGVASFADEERPWFASRVMAAIALREKELAERVSAWSEFPRFASRLAWVTSILLLAGTTWFYSRAVRAPNSQGSGAQESIFEVPQQQTAPPDDILIGVTGDLQ
jgi:hypothetical protein